MYSEDMTYSDWAFLNGQGVNDIKAVLRKRYDDFKKFYDFTYGLTDQQILALSFMTGKDQADLDALRNSFNVFKIMYEAYSGIASLAQYDYSTYGIKFGG